MKMLGAGAIALAAATQAGAATTLNLRVHTGGDDLRGGNNAFISFVLTSGRVTSEQWIGSGFGNWSQVDSMVTFPENLTLANVRAVRIRHDGSPRPGHPFDSYDNWNLRGLTVRAAGGGSLFYDSALDSARFEFIHRFTGEARVKTIALLPTVEQVDFLVNALWRVAGGFRVRVKNQGDAGVVKAVWCRTLPSSSRLAIRYVNIPLARDATAEQMVSWAHAAGESVACYADGVDRFGRAEVVTARNGRRAPL